MKVLLQHTAAEAQPLLLSNLLFNKEYFFEPSFAPIWPQAASSLAYIVFSNSNAQGYPQE